MRCCQQRLQRLHRRGAADDVFGCLLAGRSARRHLAANVAALRCLLKDALELRVCCATQAGWIYAVALQDVEVLLS
jgi:hypothetical protein